MKSIGETLKEAREAKEATIPQISMELNISKEYLIALEEERFDDFPAETYLLGFLRNYSDYLGLDVEKTITLYKNYKISEEPAPLMELVGPQSSPVVPKRLILTVFLLAVLVGGGWFGFQYFSPGMAQPERPIEVYTPADYSLDLPSVEWQLRTGDRIMVVYKGGELHMDVSVEETLCRISISDLPEEDLLLVPGVEKILPGGEGIPVIGFKLISLEDGVALLQVERTDVVPEETQDIPGSNAIPVDLNGVEDAEKILLPGVAKPESFTLNARFNSYCLLRYQADGNPAIEKYYRDGDKIRLDVDRQLMVWGSSAGAVSLSVSGVNISPGKSGEVVVKLIQWVKNDEGKYDLVLFPVQ